jgi:hypothetical protein
MKNRITTFFPSLTFSSSLFRLPLSSLFLTFLTFFLAISAQAQVPSYVPTNGLVGYWPFNGNANDESGNGNNGTVNGATLAADRFGEMDKAYSFDGVDDGILLPSDLSSFSISFWFNFFVPTNEFSELFFYEDASASIIQNGNFIYIRKQNQIVSSVDLSTDPLLINTWNNCVVIFDSNLNTIECRINNNSIYNSSLTTGGASNFVDDNQFQIGGRQFNNTNYYFGYIDDIGIWNRALTADEVLALYNGCDVAPLTVSGNVTPTQFTQETYTYPNTVGSTYNWTVTNGVIVSGQGTNSIDVMWANTGIGSVSIVETTATNCSGDVVTYDVVIIPTDVEEFSAAISLFPNPATNEINLQTTTELIGSDLIIFDALGKQIQKQQILSTNTRINTSAFAAGNYVVKAGGVVKRFEVRK